MSASVWRRLPGRSSALALATVMSVAIACGTQAEPAASAPPAATAGTQAPAATQAAAIGGGTVTVRIPGDWGMPIDPATVNNAIGDQLADAMYDRLVSFDYKSGQVIPYLAASWTTTANSVTFKLKSGATCTDGTPITPDIVKASVARLVDPATKSPWPPTIFGAGPYTVTNDPSAGTVTFATQKPYSFLLYAFTRGYTAVICPPGVRSDADFRARSYGSGPYVFDSAVQGSQYVMTKRKPRDWGPYAEASLPDKLMFQVISNETTAANSLLTGQLDITSVTGADTARLDSTATLSKYVANSYAPQTLQFNETAGRPGEDPQVREAFVTAIGAGPWADAYNKASLQGTGILSTDLQSNPNGYCYADLAAMVPKPSIPDAKAVLQKAGYAPGADGKMQKGGKVLAVTLIGSTTQNQGPEYMASQLTALGVNVDLRVSDLNTYAQAFARTDYDVVVGIFNAPTPIPAVTANYFAGKPPSQGGNNRVNRADPTLDQLVADAYGAPPDGQCAAWRALNSYILKNFIAVPMPAVSVNFYSAKAARWSFAGLANNTLDPTTIHRGDQ